MSAAATGGLLIPSVAKHAAQLAIILWIGNCGAGESPEAFELPSAPGPAAHPAALPEGVPSLQMSTDFGAPALGLGTYRPIGQVESRGFRVDPFTIRTAVHTGVGYNDNVALTRTNRISSLVFTFSPSVAVGLEGVLNRYYVVYRGNYGRYSESSVDNYEEHDILLSASNSWTSRFRSLFTYEYLRGHNPRGSTLSGSPDPERWALQALRGAVSYGAEGAQGRIAVDGGLTRLRYRTRQPSVVAREYDAADLGGAFFYRLAPKTRALLQIRRTDVEHDADPTLDNVEMRYLVGVTWEALAKVDGTVRVGYMTKDFSASARDDFAGPSYEAGLTWSPRTYSTVELSARRIFGEAVERGSSFVVNDIATIGWSHAWPRAVRSTVTYTMGRVDQEGLNRTDTYKSAGLKVSYGVRRWLRAGAEYRHDVRDSNGAGLDYRRNLSFITLEAAL